MSGITMSPDFTFYRSVADADDTLPETDEGKGFNTSDYEDVIIDVVPAGGCDPDLKILFWSDAASAFVAENTAITFTGAGADTPYQVRVKALGRKLFVAVSGIVAGDTADLYVAGWR
jgi:hypothetical protein